MRDKYAVGHDPDCWPGTTVLRNRLDIREQALLDEAEADFATLAAQVIPITAPPFDVAYLRSLHRQLFGDVYDWAGQFRRVDVSKGNTRFCTADRIEPELAKALRMLADADMVATDHTHFIEKLSECYGEVNMVHPFREGNGRAQRLFFEHWLLARQLGVDWRSTTRNEWIAACIAAVACDYAPLERIFERCILRIED